MASKRPNFLIIVADDLGYSDIGPYGSEIQTPALDKLAQDGIRMTNFHTASACSPTRAMLFSGTDNHIAGLGQMSEHMKKFGRELRENPGYEGYLNWRVAALSEVLQDVGYSTIMSGKWHLGLTRELAPISRGFDKAYAFLPGSGNHYGWEPQLSDGEFHMPCMKTEGFWMDGHNFIDINTDLPKDFYSTSSFTDRIIDYLKEWAVESKDKPFFAYLPYTAPHWPLQGPRDVTAKYAGMYDDGPDALTKKRLKRLQDLGLVKPGVETAPPVGEIGKPWDELTDQERKESARKMEVFAGMVDMIDQSVGRVVEQLESLNELDNTFILFMSDNGAEGLAMEAMPIMGGPRTMANIMDKHYDNSYDNIGEPNSFVWYGPRWACAATAPSRGSKTYILEGGIRCPCLIRYPPFQNPSAAITHSFSTVMDIMPTILDLAGVSHPGTTFRGRDVALPRGKSWTHHLKALSTKCSLEENSIHGEDTHIHGWELFGQRAIRRGPYKAVWIQPPRGKGDWELYNVLEDEAELHDLSDSHPEVLLELIDCWDVYFAETGMVDLTGQFPFNGK